MFDTALTTRFREVARRSVGSAPLVGSQGSGSFPSLVSSGYGGGFGMAPNRTLYQRNEQYGMFQSTPFSPIRLLANRLARPATKVALMAPEGRKWKPALREKSRAIPKSMESQVSKMKPVDSHVILDALDNPNPMMVSYQLKLVTFMGIEIFGDYYWWMERLENKAGKVKFRIWPVPPHWLYEAYDKSGRPDSTRWTIRPPMAFSGIDVPYASIVPFRCPDPYDPFGVLSTLQAMARPVSIDAAGELAIEAQMRNSANPGLAIITGRPPEFLGLTGSANDQVALSGPQRDELMSWFRERYQGFARAGEPLILDGLIKDVKQLNSLLSTMDNSTMAAYNESKIYKGFAVNRISLGDVESANRATASVADEHLVVNALEPRTTMFNQTATRYMGAYMQDDRGPVAVYQEVSILKDEELELRRHCEMLDRGVWSRNEVRAEQGRAPINGGDEIFLHDSQQGGGGSWIPVRPRDEDQTGADLGDLEDFAGTAPPRVKNKKRPGGPSPGYDDRDGPRGGGARPSTRPTEEGWRNVLKQKANKAEKTRLAIEKTIKKALKTWLREKFQTARAKLRNLEPGEIGVTAVNRAWPADSLRKDLERVMFPVVEAAAQAAVEFEWKTYRASKSAELRVKEAALDAAVLAQLVGAGKQAAQKAAEQIGMVAIRVWNWLRRQFHKVENQIAADRKEQVEQGGTPPAGSVTKEAAEKIAADALTNEEADAKANQKAGGSSTTIFNENRERVVTVLARAGRVKHQIWSTRRDELVRRSHRSAEGQVKIPGGSFVVGGHECQYPGDPVLPAGERENCRCVPVTVYK